jgi:hypothetical protein
MCFEKLITGCSSFPLLIMQIYASVLQFFRGFILRHLENTMFLFRFPFFFVRKLKGTFYFALIPRATLVHMTRGWQNPRIEAEIQKKTRTWITAGTVREIMEETGTMRGIATVGIPMKERNTEIVLMIVIITEARILKGVSV